MVLDLLTLSAIPTAVGASEAVHQQRVLDEEAESEERQAPFYLDIYCDAQSKKLDEVHGAIVVLRDGKVPTALAQLSTTSLTSMARTAMSLAQRPANKASEEEPRGCYSSPSFYRLLPSIPNRGPPASPYPRAPNPRPRQHNTAEPLRIEIRR